MRRVGRRRERTANRMAGSIPGGDATALKSQNRTSRVVQGMIGNPLGTPPRFLELARPPQYVQAAQCDPGVGRVLPQRRNSLPKRGRSGIRPRIVCPRIVCLRIVRGPSGLQQCLRLAEPIALPLAEQRPAAEWHCVRSARFGQCPIRGRPHDRANRCGQCGQIGRGGPAGSADRHPSRQSRASRFTRAHVQIGRHLRLRRLERRRNRRRAHPAMPLRPASGRDCGHDPISARSPSRKRCIARSMVAAD